MREQGPQANCQSPQAEVTPTSHLGQFYVKNVCLCPESRPKVHFGQIEGVAWSIKHLVHLHSRQEEGAVAAAAARLTVVVVVEEVVAAARLLTAVVAAVVVAARLLEVVVAVAVAVVVETMQVCE